MADEERKRVGILFNKADYALIEAEQARRTEARGYAVYITDMLRELVREQWGGK